MTKTARNGWGMSCSPASASTSALNLLVQSCQNQLPKELQDLVQSVVFTASPSGQPNIFFPCPLRQLEAGAAIKALEGCAAAAIADLRYGKLRRCILVDMDKVACFLMSAYLVTLDGLGKTDPEVKRKLPETDLNEAQSVLYRRLAANLYETKEAGRYYHIHGSLEASTTLRMIGLNPYPPRPMGYRKCIEVIENAVRHFTVEELEDMNMARNQAGVPALTEEEFRRTPHGSAVQKLPPFTVEKIEESAPPVPFSTLGRTRYLGGRRSRRQCLEGIKVLELCRVIAGPTIGRCLAAHGASVLKVTSPSLPDVPFFQVDVNTGKHTTALDLNDPRDRRAFDALLADADVVIDGYRPGALQQRFGIGPSQLAALGRQRGRGYVYVAESCFGGAGLRHPGADWGHRPGWQQTADCATGVAWAQGRFMGLAEPVVPPFPVSDYGTGALGAAAAMAALLRRATQGGSWAARTSLVQFDLFLLALGAYPAGVQAWMREAAHARDFFALRHHDSVDEVGRRALASIRALAPRLFADRMMHAARAEGFGGGGGAVVRWPREALRVRGLRIGHSRVSRPNGFDAPTWEDWEVDAELMRD